MSKGLAIIYDRASTKKQEDNYTRQDVKRIGTEIAHRFGFDTEPEPRFEIKSGEELKDRTVILGILEDAQAGKVKAIIVPSLTRLSRDQDVIDGLIIKKTCRDNGVRVIDFNGRVYNFENDNDQDAAFLEFWFSARDKRQLVSNTLRGAKERAIQGKFMGGFAPLGFQIIESGEVTRHGKHLKKLIKDPREAKLIRHVWHLYLEQGGQYCAASLNRRGLFLPVHNPKQAKDPKAIQRPWTKADILRIIRNPLYAGWVRWGTGACKSRPRSTYLRDFEPQMHFDASLQIISQEDFDRAQRLREQRRHMPARAVSSPHPFSYILKCAHCGGPMNGSVYSKKYRAKRTPFTQVAYRCIRHYEQPETCPTGGIVTSYPIASAVIPFVVSLLTDKAHLMEALQEAAKQYSEAGTLQQLEIATRAELEKANQAIQRLMRSIADGVIEEEEAKVTIQELRDKRERLTRDLQGFEEKRNIKAELLTAIEYIHGDLANVLWEMFKKNPRILARILQLIFKKHSVAVEGYWDPSVKGHVSTVGKRKGRLVDYELTDQFAHLFDGVSQRMPASQS